MLIKYNDTIKKLVAHKKSKSIIIYKNVKK